MNAGIDYGMGLTNIDKETGIRYGVISIHKVVREWSDSSEADYGNPVCPKCGQEIKTEYENEDNWRKVTCESCGFEANEEDTQPEEPLCFFIDDGEYKAFQSADDTDIFVEKSPYYTLCRFCSPCAPGAGDLGSPLQDGIKAYCFGHDFFDDGKAPYPVYSVETNELVNP